MDASAVAAVLGAVALTLLPGGGSAGESPSVKRSRPAAAACPDGMALIPGGKYFVGQREGHQARVAAFCIDGTEVTVAAYAACVEKGACTRASNRIEATGASAREVEEWSQYCNADRADRGDHPVNCVDWHQADAYCRAAGKRLPTEEEWEWAARGARPKVKYPWGDAAPLAQVCWNNDGKGRPAGRNGTCAVGSHPAGDSPQGVKDLGGNVWEWTASHNYGRPEMVTRGGGWYYNSPLVVSAEYREWHLPDLRSATVGFRCAKRR